MKILYFPALLFLILLGSSQVYAQDTTAIQLQEVEIRTVPYSKYATGSKIHTFDSLVLQQYNTQNLSEILMQQSAVYIKEYGNGMLNSISFRGTGASHTAVLWNGLNINLPTLGQSDFAILPLFASENIEIQAGASSSMYGSDALGGSIHLFSEALWGKHLQVGLQQNYGSFNQLFTGVKIDARTKRWQIKSKFYRTTSDNDFEFVNITKAGKPTEKQQNAGFWNAGFLQEINYKIDSKRYLSFKGWYHLSQRQIQAVMSSPGTNDNQNDRSVRLTLDYYDNALGGNLNLKLGFMQDELLFNQYAPSLVNRYVGLAEYEKNIGKKMSMKAGANWYHFQTDYANYGKKVEEDRNDIFFSFKYRPFHFWTFSFNARQAFVTGFSAPFAHSLGSEWTIFKNPNQNITIKTLFSRNYRIPTLNDRYWQPGGNPTIRPENSLSGELGLAYQYKNQLFNLEAELTYYGMLVDDWILWLPSGSSWSPFNIQKVNIKGLEANLKTSFRNLSGKWQYNFGINYAYTQSTNQTGLSQYDQSVGKQLVYTPFHRFSFSQTLIIKNWYWMLNGNFTDFRYTTSDNANFLNAFFLLNTDIGKNIPVKQSMISIALKINNILDTAYQNYEYYAMPQINYQFSIRYQWKK